jgi:hypothetical protein
LTEAGFEFSPDTVARLLKNELGLSRRKLAKTLALGASPDRNAQFQRLAELKAEYLEKGWPVISIDTKRRNCWGISPATARRGPTAG